MLSRAGTGIRRYQSCIQIMFSSIEDFDFGRGGKETGSQCETSWNHYLDPPDAGNHKRLGNFWKQAFYSRTRQSMLIAQTCSTTWTLRAEDLIQDNTTRSSSFIDSDQDHSLVFKKGHSAPEILLISSCVAVASASPGVIPSTSALGIIGLSVCSS